MIEELKARCSCQNETCGHCQAVKHLQAGTKNPKLGEALGHMCNCWEDGERRGPRCLYCQVKEALS